MIDSCFEWEREKSRWKSAEDPINHVVPWTSIHALSMTFRFSEWVFFHLSLHLSRYPQSLGAKHLHQHQFCLSLSPPPPSFPLVCEQNRIQNWVSRPRKCRENRNKRFNEIIGYQLIQNILFWSPIPRLFSPINLLRQWIVCYNFQFCKNIIK